MGPLQTVVDLVKLARGRTPQVPYLSGTTVKGGAGRDVTIQVPKGSYITDVARLRQTVLAIVNDGVSKSDLLTIDEFTGKVLTTTPHVSSILTADDGQFAVYIGDGPLPGKANGTTVYFAGSSVQRLVLPTVNNSYPLGFVNGKVYYRGSPTDDYQTWSLYEWRPGTTTARRVSTIPSATALSNDGTVAASSSNVTDYVSCTNVASVATGSRLWRSCDYRVTGFSPDDRTALGGPYYREGTGDFVVAAIDAKSGTVLHEWKGPFRDPVAEDDEHVLITTFRGENAPNAILRCTIATGACELATPLTKTAVELGT
ncbi:hypothetical protein AB0E69_14555 [Kribbella sp. NPDC026611]|uniref:hypothetical protein n=1 Tax=Kribbella sp. NPDC026611 TaxID=3154911 RepID=UPI0033F28CF7